jgi:hypothetical protein
MKTLSRCNIGHASFSLLLHFFHVSCSGAAARLTGPEPRGEPWGGQRGAGGALKSRRRRFVRAHQEVQLLSVLASKGHFSVTFLRTSCR